MAAITREVLTADGMSLIVFCGGSSNVGIGVTGTWVGTVSMSISTNDNPNVFVAVPVTPFPSGTAVTTTTANGNWFFQNKANIFSVKVVFSRTSGSVQVNIATAVDSSWQDAFLVQGGGNSPIFNSKEVTGGSPNTMTQAAQANRAWNLNYLEVCLNGPQFQGQANISIYDGTIAGTLLWKEYIPTGGGSVGYTYVCNLPKDDSGNVSLVNTPGNAMTIQVNGISANGSSIINAKFKAG